MNKLPRQADIVAVAKMALVARKGFEKKAGQCKRWVRQVQIALKVPERVQLPVGIDAKQSAQWVRDNCPGCIMHNGSVPGDVLIWENGHGPHGHMGIRIPGNKLAENSVAHAPVDTEDGRGTRDLSQLGEPDMVFRFWRGK